MFKFIVALLPLVHDRKASGLENKKLKQKITEVCINLVVSARHLMFIHSTTLDAKKAQRVSFCATSC